MPHFLESSNNIHQAPLARGSLAVGGPLNAFYPGTLRLPEFRLDTWPQNVFNIPKLYYESQTSIGFFERQAGKSKSATREKPSYKPGNWAYYELSSRRLFIWSIGEAPSAAQIVRG